MTVTDPRTISLARMRSKAVAALSDTNGPPGPGTDQAHVRLRLFCEAASDLAGSSVEAEMATARGEQAEQPWAHTPHER